MGKQRVAHLLAQLKDNQSQDLHNSAAIYTVAQVAVNALDQPPSQRTALAAPVPPTQFTRADLLQRYGSYNACRRAARQQGIRFQKTPSWAQLESAFTWQLLCTALIQSCLPSDSQADLSGVSFTFDLDTFR